MRSFYILLVLGVTAALATADTLTPTQDTFITEHSTLSGPNSTHAADPILFAIWANNGFPRFRTFPLVKFDLTSYAGQTIVGAATFELFLQGTTVFPQATRNVSVHEVLIPWTDATITFNTFGGAPDVQFGTDVGAALDTQAVAYPTPGNRYVSWTIPAAVVQGWIDNPGSNNGFLVFNQAAPNIQDLEFGSMEAVNQPRLTFRAVPEPTSVSLLALSAVGLFVFRRRGA